MKYVNVYLRDRAFGGSEEGGWWYDTADPVKATWVDAWKGKRAPKGKLVPSGTTWEQTPDGAKWVPVKEVVASYRATPRRIARLEKWAAKENVGRRDIGSVLSEGRFAVYVEPFPARPQPDCVPRYE